MNVVEVEKCTNIVHFNFKATNFISSKLGPTHYKCWEKKFIHQNYYFSRPGWWEESRLWTESRLKRKSKNKPADTNYKELVNQLFTQYTN